MITPIVSEVAGRTQEALRGTLVHAYEGFGAYRELFDELGMARADILDRDPMTVLGTLPLLEGDRFYRLVDESILAGDQIVDIEVSSGTTGARKRRVISHDDDISETACLADMFAVCGIGASDRVACVDTGPLTLMVSFTKALDSLGVQEAYAYSVGPDVGAALEHLAALTPTVLITVSSILERITEGIKRSRDSRACEALRKVVYVGEPLSPNTRRFLEDDLGVEVFGYYGASETSALGIECQSHAGIHLLTDRNVIELVRRDGDSGAVGELVVTTLQQQALPLLRYALRDLVEVVPGQCPCGLEYPRVEILGRVDDTVSLLGSKFSYDGILDAAYRSTEGERLLEVILTRNGAERLTLVLPDDLAQRERQIRGSLLSGETELGYLAGSRLVDVELAFVDRSHFASSRKPRRIVDRRGG